MSKSRDDTNRELELYSLRISRKTEELYNEVKGTLKELALNEDSYRKAVKKLDIAYTDALASTNFNQYFTTQTIAVIVDVSWTETVLSESVKTKAEYARKLPRISLFDDNIKLSERIRNNYDEIVIAQKGVLDNALEAGQGIVKTARQINNLGGFDPEIPRYIRDLERFKINGRKIPNANIRRVKKQIEKIKTPGLKKSYLKLVNAIELGDNIDKATEAALKQKTLSYSNRLAKSESINTQSSVKVARHAKDPKTQWVRSVTSGPNPCNFCLSSEDLGFVPIETAPKFIYHPYCSCNLRFKRSATKKAEPWSQKEYQERFDKSLKKFGVTYVDNTELRNLRENTINDKLKRVN